MRAAAIQACPPDLRGPERVGLPAVQKLFPFARPLATRCRSLRSPFRPAKGEGAYRLPHDIRDRLAASLAPFRNREAAFALAVFLARFWSVPGRVSGSFPIDRRALADRPDLGLTEKRVRNAIRTLEAVGFLDRAVASGSRYKATEDGLRRKPIMFCFGSDYAREFMEANRRAAAARGARSSARRAPSPSVSPRPSVAVSEARHAKRPKTSKASKTVPLGPLRRESGIPPQTSVPDANLEAALDRLRRAIGIAGGGSGA
jgi:hypothetical protein